MMLPVPFAMTIIKHLNSPSSAARDISRVIKAPFRRHHQQQRRARAAKTAEMPFPPPRFPILALTEVFPPLSTGTRRARAASVRFKQATNFALSRHQPEKYALTAVPLSLLSNPSITSDSCLQPNAD